MKKLQPSQLDDIQWLTEQYQYRSLQSIADELGVHRNSVRNRLIQFGVKRRNKANHFLNTPKSESQRQKMSQSRKKYWENHPDRTEFKLKISTTKAKTRISNKGRRIYILGRGRILEHRYIAEQMLGRPLLPNEQVHHRDRNRLNNSPDNLEILTNSRHQKLHNQTRPRNKKGQFIKE